MAANNHSTQILETLQALRKYALEKSASRKLVIGLQYHEEDSNLMRFANSAISLNTNEHLIRINVEAFEDRKRASYELITDLSKLDEMKKGIDTVIELVAHAQPLTYQPSVPSYPDSFIDEGFYDPALAQITNADRLNYFNQVAAGLESDDVKLSGIFSNGSTINAMIWTTSENTQYFRHSDAQVTAVLASASQKWEVISEASAQQVSDLNAGCLNRDLAGLIGQLKGEAP
jgi:hypothetical protein